MHKHTETVGSLSWGIKDSFRDYVSRQADFSLTVSDHASIGPGNVIQFPVKAGSGNVEWMSEGWAVFVAHGGMMRLSLKNPVVRWSDLDLVLAFEFDSGMDGSQPEHFEVARLVEVSTTEDTMRRTYRAFLLPDAVGMFNEMYDPGSELDVVTVAMEVTH